MPESGPGLMRAHLISRPTPLEAAPRLAQAIGLEAGDLWIKRDDLTGLGGGGNKARKLERTAGAAVAHGATTLVTSGAAQSNHARLTAAAGGRLGMDVVLVLSGRPGEPATGHIALDGLFGARIVWAGEVGDATLEDAGADVAAQLRASGRRPEVIPFGGSSVLGAQGYVEAGEELLAQLPGLTSAVVAVGSGGTMAGLVLALGAEHVLGVHCRAVPDPEQAVARLVGGLSGDQQAGPLRLRPHPGGPRCPPRPRPVRGPPRRGPPAWGRVRYPRYT